MCVNNVTSMRGIAASRRLVTGLFWCAGRRRAIFGSSLMGRSLLRIAMAISFIESPCPGWGVEPLDQWISQKPQFIDFRDVCYGNGMFVAVGAGGQILSSMDGITWNIRTNGTARDLYSVCHGNGRFVTVG